MGSLPLFDSTNQGTVDHRRTEWTSDYCEVTTSIPASLVDRGVKSPRPLELRVSTTHYYSWVDHSLQVNFGLMRFCCDSGRLHAAEAVNSERPG